MKHGIILAGGNGKRLFPLTETINKHMLGVSGRFIIDYPIHTLKQMGIENCTVVLGGSHFSQVVDHLKDGRNHGINFNYVFQGEASGIAQGINICQSYVGDQDFAVILGDNIFEDQIVFDPNYAGAQITVKQVLDPKRFGVLFCHGLDKIEKIVEKPQVLDHNYECWAITGCYRFDQQYFEYFKQIKPSIRDEFEITDIIEHYHKDSKLKASPYYSFWHDVGTHESIAYVNDYFHSKKQTW